MESQLEIAGRLACCGISELEPHSGGLRLQILQLEERVEAEIKTARARVGQLRAEKMHTPEELVLQLLGDMKTRVGGEHEQMKAQIRDYFAGLAGKNQGIQTEISALKKENLLLQDCVSQLNKRLQTLETALGAETG